MRARGPLSRGFIKCPFDVSAADLIAVFFKLRLLFALRGADADKRVRGGEFGRGILRWRHIEN